MRWRGTHFIERGAMTASAVRDWLAAADSWLRHLADTVGLFIDRGATAASAVHGWLAAAGSYLLQLAATIALYGRRGLAKCSHWLASQPFSLLACKLAAKNLLYDKLRFIATIVGVVFSMVLVIVQMGLFVSFGRMVTSMIDHAPADLWIMPLGTKCFEDLSLLDQRERFRALSIQGVADVAPILISFGQWKAPGGGTTPVLVVGSDVRGPGLRPWNIVEGSLDALSIPDAVAIDRAYLQRLGVAGVGDTTEINDRKAKIVAVTTGIRSFTTTPYVFTTLDRARVYTGVAPNKATYLLVRLTAGADLESVRAQINATIPKIEALTPSEFRARSRSFWLFGTGAGAALFGGALLGLIVGLVIVAQTLYSSTKEFSHQFATLRAIGSSSRYIHAIIVIQAVLSAIVGFGVAAGIGWIVVRATAEAPLPVVMTPVLTAGLFVLTVAMCLVSAIGAIVQIMRMDPAVVFAR